MGKLILPNVDEVGTIACFGTGTMFRGWAALFLSAGLRVVAYDPIAAARASAQADVEKFVAWLHAKGKLLPQTAGADPSAIMRNLTILDDLSGFANLHPEIAFEIVTENRDLKAKVFAQMNELFGPQVIFWSNTSGITTIADISGRPDRTLVTHGMNPPHLTKAVEVVPHELLDPAVLDFTHRFLRERLGKITFNAPNVPGFLVNRLGIPFWLNVIFLIEEEGTSVQDIDTGITGSLGHPQGPCLLMDLIGLDVMKLVSDDMYNAEVRSRFEDQFETPELLDSMVECGNLGKKSGKGFYDWSDPKNPQPIPVDQLAQPRPAA